MIQFLKSPFLRILITLCLLVFLAWQVDFKQAFLNLKLIKIDLFVSAFLLLQVVFVLQSQRWKDLIDAIPNSKNIPLSQYIYHNLQGHFYNQFLPTSIGGDTVKTLALGIKINNKTASFLSTFLNRWMGLFWVILIFWGFAFFHLDFLNKLQLIYPVFAFTLFLLFVGWVIWFAKFPVPTFLQSMKQKSREVISYYQSNPRLMIHTFVYSGLIQVCILIVEYLIYRSAGMNVSIAQIFFLVPVVYIVTLLPISIAGYGLREGIVIYLFSTALGVPKDLCLSTVWVSYILAFSQALLAGLVLLFYKSGKNYGKL